MIKEFDALYEQEGQTVKIREAFYYGLWKYLKENLLDVIQETYIFRFEISNGYSMDVYSNPRGTYKNYEIRKKGKTIVRVEKIFEKEKDNALLCIKDENITMIKEFTEVLPSLLNQTLREKYDKEKYKADEKEALYEMLYRQPI